MVDAPVRVAGDGSGFVADLHVDASAGLAGAELAGLVDIDPARAAASRRAGGVPFDAGLDHAVKSWAVDAAIICTPNDTHTHIATTLAEVGVHALVEKLLATTPAEPMPSPSPRVVVAARKAADGATTVALDQRTGV